MPSPAHIARRVLTRVTHRIHALPVLVLMPHSYQVNDRHRPAGAALSRAALGLAESACVLCCFNQSYKILPEVIAILDANWRIEYVNPVRAAKSRA